MDQITSSKKTMLNTIWASTPSPRKVITSLQEISCQIKENAPGLPLPLLKMKNYVVTHEINTKIAALFRKIMNAVLHFLGFQTLPKAIEFKQQPLSSLQEEKKEIQETIPLIIENPKKPISKTKIATIIGSISIGIFFAGKGARFLHTYLNNRTILANKEPAKRETKLLPEIPLSDAHKQTFKHLTGKGFFQGFSTHQNPPPEKHVKIMFECLSRQKFPLSNEEFKMWRQELTALSKTKVSSKTLTYLKILTELMRQGEEKSYHSSPTRWKKQLNYILDTFFKKQTS